MGIYEGTYKFERGGGGKSIGDTPLWRCTLKFDGMEVQVYAGSRRRAFRKVNKAMTKALKLRYAVRSVKGLCDE